MELTDPLRGIIVLVLDSSSSVPTKNLGQIAEAFVAIVLPYFERSLE